MEYKLVRSERKTVSLQLTPEGLVVRAPLRTPVGEIEKIIESHRGWIEKHAPAVRQAADAAREAQLSTEDIRALAEKALREIPPRVAFWAQRMGVTYGRITIRNQRSKWGSCSAKGNLNFNCLLMLAPPEVLDSVIVHELAHRKEMNHSKAFYDTVYAVFPEYDRVHRWLKENGEALLRRMAG